MASIGHIAVGIALGRAWAPKASKRVLVAGMVAFSALSMLPDADVISFAFGIPYTHVWGHRGASHSIAFAAALALIAAVDTRPKAFRTAFFVFVAVASHGVLDAMTDGGLGPALLWPWTEERFFFPFRPLPVAPIGLQFLTVSGLKVAAVEFFWFLPFFLYAVWPRRTPAVNPSL